MALMSEKEAEILKKHICEFYNMKSENEELRTMLSQCAADIQKIKRVNELFGADPDKDYIHMGKIEKLLNKDYSDAQTNTDYIWRKLQENEKLKEMLKLAVSELEASMDRDEYDCCDTCKHKDEHPCHPSYNCYEWEYKEQALKLIGGESNEN